jgi:predicted CoA-binding protein
MNSLESDDSLIALLESAKTIAVVGIKDRQSEDAFRIPLYMQRAGYRIVPVNPKLDAVLEEECHPSLMDVDTPIDVVNLFRASEHVAGHVDEILSLGPPPKAVWMQLGIHHGESAQRLREAGIEVIQDRCIMVDHRRLLGAKEQDGQAAPEASANASDKASTEVSRA